jgi:hypothetical protein
MAPTVWRKADYATIWLVYVFAASVAVLAVAAWQAIGPTDAARWSSILCAIMAYGAGYFGATLWLRANGIRLGAAETMIGDDHASRQKLFWRSLSFAIPFGICISKITVSIWNEQPIGDFGVGLAVGILLTMCAITVATAPRCDPSAGTSRSDAAGTAT